MNIRIVEKDDLEKVGEIARAAFKDYSESDFLKMSQNQLYKFWVVETEFSIAGFLIVLTVDDKMEVIKIATAENFRRRGIAKKLLLTAFDAAKKMGKTGVILEVNEKNLPARELYRSLGFKEIFVRKRYYEGTFDAIIMELMIN